jgi:hypothetical protein
MNISSTRMSYNNRHRTYMSYYLSLYTHNLLKVTAIAGLNSLNSSGAVPQLETIKRFDMGVAFTANYSFSGRRRPVDNETLLMTDFTKLKIKLAQSFDVLIGVGCACVCSYG